MPEEDEEVTPSGSTPIALQEFTCERCGYRYHKAFDFVPYMCYRCMRFIAKRVYVTLNTITPLSRPEKTEDI